MKLRSVSTSAALALGYVAWTPALHAQIPPADPAPTTGPYLYVDQVEGDYVDYNSVPRRPIAFTENDLYAVHTQSSTVVHFHFSTSIPSGNVAPTNVFSVPKSPVSIALWDDPDATGEDDGERLVVVCDGTYCVVVLDRSSGDVLELIELRRPPGLTALGEPGDLLVDDTSDLAYVSCAAADAVVEIDLRTASISRVFDLPAKDPVFMCFDENGDVLVAPQLSGNNSGARPSPTVVASAGHEGPTVVDFATQALNTTRLPDEDLFLCDVSAGTVAPVLRGMGSVLFACGVNPQTGDFWQLNTEANNKDSGSQTEASIQGNIVANRLTIAAIGSSTPPTFVDLDRLVSSTPDPSYTVGQPYALGFVDSTGQGLVAGLLTDNVTVLSSSGAYQRQIDLPEGSIPRAAQHHASASKILVYCWGTSKIEVYADATPFAHHAQLDLGYDPTPESIQEGREVFYDASFSASNNASCASCHVEGRTDMLVWNLSSALDDKGPMITQTLAGIERLVPFHWRGEQQNGLVDFKGAFVNLLGASAEPEPAQFAAFQDFVFSIQNRPNPFENEERQLDLAIQPPKLASLPDGDPMAGQVKFVDTCERCHSFPMGTNNDVMNPTNSTRPEQNPRRLYFKNTPFNDIYKKEQDLDRSTPENDMVTIDLANLANPSSTDSFLTPLTGGGMTHAGLFNDLHEFNNVIFGHFTDQEVSDVTAFVYQWDQGLAPAVNRGVLLDQAHHTSATAFLQNYLIPQADARNCDVVAFGVSRFSGVDRALRWLYDRGTQQFIADDSSISDQSLSFFTGQAQLGRGRNVFLGVPVGSGRRFAIDYDGDELLNVDEGVPTGTYPCSATNPDSDGDGDPDGHETANGGDPCDDQVVSSDATDPSVDRAVTAMVSGKTARINVETSEPCTVTIDYGVSGGPPLSKSTKVFARTHSIVLDDLALSAVAQAQEYDGTITIEDLAGRSPPTPTAIPPMPAYNLGLLSSTPSVPIVTRLFSDDPVGASVIQQLAWDTTTNSSSGTLHGHAKLKVYAKTGGPQTGRRVIARVFVDGVLSSSFSDTGASDTLSGFSFDPLNVTFTGLTGPFLISAVTDSGGNTTLDFDQSITSGQVVTLNIELVVDDPSSAGSPFNSIRLWNMPTTSADDRKLDYP